MKKLDPGDTVLGSISLVSVAIGLPLNLMMLTYFFTYAGKRTLSFLLYSLICVVDIFIISSHIPTTASYLGDRSPLMFGSDIFCSIWGLVWNTAMRVSVFIIAVLCVSRMIAVVFPLRKLKRLIPIAIISVYALLISVQSSVPFWFGGGYLYDKYGVTCYDRNEYGPVHYFLVGFLEFLAPLFVVCPACSVSIVCLCKSRKKGRKFTKNTNNCRLDRRNSATKTMILLTLAYIIFNAPLVLYTLFAFLNIATGTKVFDHFLNAFHGAEVEAEGHFHLLNFTFTVSVCLNSAANAILFVCRSAAIKAWLRRAGNSGWWGKVVRQIRKRVI
jgi:hypothetical protein